MRYEWMNERTSETTQTRWNFVELATLVFEDEHCLMYQDRVDCKTDEQRWHAIGTAQIEPEVSVVLLVVHAYREDIMAKKYPHHLSPCG